MCRLFWDLIVYNNIDSSMEIFNIYYWMLSKSANIDHADNSFAFHRVQTLKECTQIVLNGDIFML